MCAATPRTSTAGRQVAHRGWAYQDVLPYFRKLERYGRGADAYRGGDGPVKVERLGDNHPLEDAFLDAAVQAGYRRVEDYNGAEQEGVSEFDANQSGGRRWGTGHACIRPARGRPNVEVRTHARATKLLMENGRVLGVRYLQGGLEKTVYAAREVVLSAGAIQSPHLLMLSGIGPADHLRTNGIKPVVDLPGVGENLQDHLEAHLKYRCPPGRSKNRLLKRHRVILLGLEWFLFRMGEAATTQSRVGGFLKIDPAADYPDMQYHFWPYHLDGWSPLPDEDGYTSSVGPVAAESRGWVRLASNDPTAAPLMRLNGLGTDKDIRDFRQAIRITREIAQQSAFDGSASASSHPARRSPRTAPSTPMSASTPTAPTTPAAPARWARTRWRWWTRNSASTASTGCGWSTPRSCRRSPTATSTRRP